MRSFGYLFVVLGIAAMRQVAVGRVKDTPDDMRDIATALLSGDMTGVGEVMSRRGENVSGGGADIASPPGATPTGDASGNALVSEMVRLGNAAPKGYVWGASGPSGYDCSGIVWRAVQNIGVYKGPRFTTSTLAASARGWATQTQTPRVGDIVLWNHSRGGHMGVVTGPDELYSARSPSKGIGKSSLSGDTKSFGVQPTYWRIAP